MWQFIGQKFQSFCQEKKEIGLNTILYSCSRKTNFFKIEFCCCGLIQECCWTSICMLPTPTNCMKLLLLLTSDWVSSLQATAVAKGVAVLWHIMYDIIRQLFLLTESSQQTTTHCYWAAFKTIYLIQSRGLYYKAGKQHNHRFNSGLSVLSIRLTSYCCPPWRLMSPS